MERFFLGALAGYGYGVERLIVMLAALWVGGALIYGEAAHQGLMAPTSPVIFADKDLKAACQSNWPSCDQLPREHTAFAPWMYSADALLPVVSLGIEEDWAPIYAKLGTVDLPHGSALRFELAGMSRSTPPGFLRFVYWAQILLGWAMSLLLVAVLSGAMKRE
ncbi:MAG: hypothetical protein V3V97_11400 [Hyphomicrobiaceae bacterium]